MKKREIQIMTTLLLADFIALSVTGLWMRFGRITDNLQQTHAILGMFFILLVFYHWHLFLTLYFHLWGKNSRKQTVPVNRWYS